MYNHLCHQGASRMRGRLGSMGSISSFERVGILEGEHENSHNFTRGTLVILTFYPVAFKSRLFHLCPQERASVIGMCFHFISVSSWRLPTFLFSHGDMSLHCIIPTLIHDAAALAKRQNSTAGGAFTELSGNHLGLLAPLCHCCAECEVSVLCSPYDFPSVMMELRVLHQFSIALLEHCCTHVGQKMAPN